MKNPLSACDTATELGDMLLAAFQPKDQDEFSEELAEHVIMWLRTTVFRITPEILSIVAMPECWSYVPFVTSRSIEDSMAWVMSSEHATIFFLQLFGLLRNEMVRLFYQILLVRTLSRRIEACGWFVRSVRPVSPSAS